MTDRELLELAAKAAGISLQWGGINGDAPIRKDNWEFWNPLTDDSDALRLAVKLGIEYGYGWGPGDTIQRVIIDDNLHVMVENGDVASAVRIAIVRAAAEIGRGHE